MEPERALELLDFSKNGGLVTAVAQDAATGEVLMLAHMNELAFRKTLETGRAVYWSRSRDRLWAKGEESGNVQELRELRIDCDGDAVLLVVEQVGGAACHTGRRSCFYRRIDGDAAEAVDVGVQVFDPDEVYSK